MRTFASKFAVTLSRRLAETGNKMESPDTNREYKEAVAACRGLYEAKLQDYGAAWHVLRPSSLTDQIYIKAKRIQTLQLTGENRVGEDIRGEFVGIVNYSIMALIQLELGYEDRPLGKEAALAKYDEYAGKAFALSSLVDIILMKILRTKQIEDSHGKTSVSEGLDANYYDMLNYAVFALIRIMETE